MPTFKKSGNFPIHKGNISEALKPRPIGRAPMAKSGNFPIHKGDISEALKPRPIGHAPMAKSGNFPIHKGNISETLKPKSKRVLDLEIAEALNPKPRRLPARFQIHGARRGFNKVEYAETLAAALPIAKEWADEDFLITVMEQDPDTLDYQVVLVSNRKNGKMVFEEPATHRPY